MPKIVFYLPQGSKSFRDWENFADEEKEAARDLYFNGKMVEVNASGMRVPAVEESVLLPGILGECYVKHVSHVYADEDTGEPLEEPYAYVVLA